MKIFILNVKVYVTKDISKNESLQEIGKLIDRTLSDNEKYLELHNKNCYKNYCYNDLYPIEQDKVYKEDSIYSFKLRTVDKDLAIYLSEELSNCYTDSIKVLKVDLKIMNQKHISKIYSITPIVLKTENGYWRGNLSSEEYEERLRVNLIKKYNCFTGQKINEDFPLFTAIEFNNRKPIATNYKNIRILGDKINLTIADDETSQNIAHFAIGVGILELNSRGFGFMNYRWL